MRQPVGGQRSAEHRSEIISLPCGVSERSCAISFRGPGKVAPGVAWEVTMSGSGRGAATVRRGQEEFFAGAMYVVDVQGWPSDLIYSPRPLEHPQMAPEGARLRLWETDPRDARHIPPPNGSGTLLDTTGFSLVNSGNRTLYAPKRSWKVDLGGGDGEVAGMS